MAKAPTTKGGWAAAVDDKKKRRGSRSAGGDERAIKCTGNEKRELHMEFDNKVCNVEMIPNSGRHCDVAMELQPYTGYTPRLKNWGSTSSTGKSRAGNVRENQNSEKPTESRSSTTSTRKGRDRVDTYGFDRDENSTSTIREKRQNLEISSECLREVSPVLSFYLKIGHFLHDWPALWVLVVWDTLGVILLVCDLIFYWGDGPGLVDPISSQQQLGWKLFFIHRFWHVRRYLETGGLEDIMALKSETICHDFNKAKVERDKALRSSKLIVWPYILILGGLLCTAIVSNLYLILLLKDGTGDARTIFKIILNITKAYTYFQALTMCTVYDSLIVAIVSRFLRYQSRFLVSELRSDLCKAAAAKEKGAAAPDNAVAPLESDTSLEHTQEEEGGGEGRAQRRKRRAEIRAAKKTARKENGAMAAEGNEDPGKPSPPDASLQSRNTTFVEVEKEGEARTQGKDRLKDVMGPSEATWRTKTNRAMVKLSMLTGSKVHTQRIANLKKQNPASRARAVSTAQRKCGMVEELQKAVKRWEESGSGSKQWLDESFNSPSCIFGPTGKTDPTIAFRHASDFALEPVLFGNAKGDEIHDIHPNDICQGQLGDCYFLAALAVLAEEPSRIKAIIRATVPSWNAGIACARININGTWEKILLDLRFPCSRGGVGEKWSPTYSTSQDGTELWVLLLEKAWAKAHKSYAAIVSGTPGDALRDLTGAPSKRFIIESSGGDVTDRDTLWRKLLNARQHRFLICASISGDENSAASEQLLKSRGLIQGHSYSVLDARVAGAKNEKLVCLRNPWGREEWKGDWSDGDKKWTEALREELGHHDREDGLFFMPYTEFYHHFSSVDICHFRDRFEYSCIPFDISSCVDLLGITFKVARKIDAIGEVEASLFLIQEDERHYGDNRDDKAVDYEYIQCCFEIYIVEEDFTWSYVGGSDYHACRETFKDLVLLVERDYICVIRCLCTRNRFTCGDAMDKRKLVFGAYSSDQLSFSMMNDPVNFKKRQSALEDAIIADGNVLFDDQNGAKAFEWQDEQNSLSALLFCTKNVPLWVDLSLSVSHLLVFDGFAHNMSVEGLKKGLDRQDINQKEHQIIVQIDPKVFVHRHLVIFSPIFDSKSISFSRSMSYGHSSEICPQCLDPVGVALGKFGGSFFIIDGVKIHSECRQQYDEAHADKCSFCGLPVAEIPGKFDGSFYNIEEGKKIHSECWTAYQDVHAEKCVQCKMPIDGSYYDIDTGKVHSGCWNAYQDVHAEKCLQCKRPIDGSYYDTENAGKLHEACWATWKEACQRKAEDVRRPARP